MCDRSSADKNELVELYPEGRHLYYEGDDPAGFIKELKERYGLGVSVSFHCPAELLDEIYSGADGAFRYAATNAQTLALRDIEEKERQKDYRALRAAQVARAKELEEKSLTLIERVKPTYAQAAVYNATREELVDLQKANPVIGKIVKRLKPGQRVRDVYSEKQLVALMK
jgi:hypothetical protein